jgi:hypothetical protein
MAKDGGKAERDAKLAKALRANLARRKAQARARRAGAHGVDENPPSVSTLPDAQKSQESEG